MFENDGIDTLQSPDVVQEKRIIFWNLVGHLPYIKFRLTELVSLLIGYTPYSKMAANKLSFCLHVN